MKALFKLLLGIFLLFLLMNYFFPARQAPDKHPTQSSQITLAEVSAKSQDALITTATFMNQEKVRLGAAMSVTLQKLDRLIAQMQDTAATLPEQERPAFQHKINDWQNTRSNVVQLQSRLRPAENSTMDHLKANWQTVEVEISDRLLHENR